MSIDEQPMNVYWSGQKSSTSNKYKINYKGTVATANDLPATGNKKSEYQKCIQYDLQNSNLKQLVMLL